MFADDQSKRMFYSLIAFRKTSDPTLLTVSDFDDYWHPIVQPAPGDGIIDAGAWIGDTCLFFAQKLNGNCSICSFEPDASNYHTLYDNIYKANLEAVIKPIKFGLWQTNTCLNFSDSGTKTDQFRIDESGDKKIEVVSLDEFVKANVIKVDLIKMDIEGAEYEALLGSKSILKKVAPKLQICIYHKPDDLWRIPLLIKQINPEYKFYLGVHKQHFIDTVLYATVR